MNKHMSTSQKRPIRARGWLLPLGLLGLCAALIFALVALQKPHQTPAEETENAGQLTLFECARADVRSIQLTPPSGESYTLIHRDGSLYLDADEPYLIRRLISDNLLSALCTVIMEEQVLNTHKTVSDLGAFGLENPVCSAVLTLQNGETHHLRLGDAMQFGIPYRYCMWDDDPWIYAISADVFDVFSYTREALHPVTQPVWDHRFWDQVTIRGEVNRTLTLTPAGWQLTSPIGYPVSTESAESFLSSVESISFATYVGAADQLDLAALGLVEPRLTLTIKQAATVATYTDDTGAVTEEILLPEEDITVSFGHDKDDYYVYCMYLDTVYTATRFQTAFLWNEDLSSLADPTPLDVRVTKVMSVTASTADETHVYTLSLTEQLLENGELKQDDLGNVLYDVHVRKDGIPMDADAFLMWYTAVHALSPSHSVPDAQALSQSPLLTLTLSGDGFSRSAAFLPLDSLHTALSVNGTAFSYLQNTDLADILALP